MHCRNEFIDDATTLDIDQRLQFHSHVRIVADLAGVGLVAETIYSDWDSQPFHGEPTHR